MGCDAQLTFGGIVQGMSGCILCGDVWRVVQGIFPEGGFIGEYPG